MGKNETLTNNTMTNPKEIITVIHKASYMVPMYAVTDAGLEHVEDFRIDFCKGNKEDQAVERRVGFFTETLIATAKKFLEQNNDGPLASKETVMAIIKLEEALLWIGKRAEDRKNRGVQGSYRQ